jgi:rubredoxin
MTAAASNPKRSASSSPKEYRCNLCGRVFDSDETLNSHKKMDHGQKGHQIPAGVG